MVVRDALTGYLHEVPDRYGSGGFSGFGYPHGFVSAFGEEEAPPPGPEAAEPPPMEPSPAAAPPMGPPPVLRRVAPPVGWITPALPFTGRQPRRLYLRCSVWPGQAGLVPIAAGAPGMVPGVTPLPGMLPGLLPGAIPLRPRGPFRRPPIWRRQRPVLRRAWRR